MTVKGRLDFGPARRAVDAGTTRGLAAAADVAGEASQALVPVLEGDLRDSLVTSVDGDTAAIAFTDFKAPWQHERLDYDHPGGGQAKFLEQAVVASRGEQLRALAREMRKGFDS